MAQATQKIVLSSARDIPFNKLVLSQANVRRIKTGVSIEELAEDIARRTLLQSLNVRPVVDADGNETGMFEVPAGGRRYRALELLVRQKRLAKTAPIPCVIRTNDNDVCAEEDSLAENLQRQALHPLDQFRSFKVLVDKGLSEEDIAARFFVPVNVVKQRLRLTTVSEKLLEIYAADGMSLDQLTAFSVSSDHARQEQVWESLSRSYNKEAYYIRRLLTESAVRVDDRRAQFVGIATYEAAGGVVMRDLFTEDRGGWLQDPALLDRLVDEKLKAEAAVVAAEGWKWVMAALDFKYGHTNGLRRLAGEPIERTEEEVASYEALKAEFDAMNEQFDSAEDLPEEADARLSELETAIAAFEDQPRRYAPEEIARAGVFVSLSAEGRLEIECGFVRPEDEAPVSTETGGELDQPSASVDEVQAVQRAVITIAGAPAETDDDDDDDGIRPLSDRLVAELTAYRTLALQDAVANNPHVALTVLLHKLVKDAFERSPAQGCLEAAVRRVTFPVQPDELKDSSVARSVVARHEGWLADLPADDGALWDWLEALDQASRIALLAHCVSYGVNALYEKPSPYSGYGVSKHGLEQRLGQADRLARAVGLDLVEAGWRPTVDNYLSRVTKARILEAVHEGAGEHAAQLIDHLKKGDMAREAERLLADSRWLPEPLRIRDLTALEAPRSSEAGTEGEILPAFLTDATAGVDAPDLDPETPHLAAAE